MPCDSAAAPVLLPAGFALTDGSIAESSRYATQSTSRRECLLALLSGTALAAVATVCPRQAEAADSPLLNPAEPAAKAVKYTEDASRATGVPAENRCASCALYQGPYGSTQGPCQLFAGKQVKANGWCSSWSPQM